MRLFFFEKTLIPALVASVILMGLYEASFTGFLLNIGPEVTKAMLYVMYVGAAVMLLSAVGVGLCCYYHRILLWGGMLGMLLLAILFGGYALAALHGMEIYDATGIPDATWYRNFHDSWFLSLSVLVTSLLARYLLWERHKFV
jgi:hypothetical protein